MNDAVVAAWKSQWLPVATGVAAGSTEAFVVVPFDLVKIRLQDKVIFLSLKLVVTW